MQLIIMFFQHVSGMIIFKNPDTELSEFISEGIYFVEDDKLKKQ